MRRFVRSFAGSSFLGSKMRCCCCLLPVFSAVMRCMDGLVVVALRSVGRWWLIWLLLFYPVRQRRRKQNANNFRICPTRDSFCEMQMFYCVYAIILSVTVHTVFAALIFTLTLRSLSLSGFKLR